MFKIYSSAHIAPIPMLNEVSGNNENLFFNYKLKTMSEFKGTNGKWYFSDQDFKVRGTGDIEGMTVIANVSPKMDYSRGSGTQFANGRLIAAAPDLLEALKELVELKEWKNSAGKDESYITMQPLAWQKAKDAINKAIG